MLRSLKNLENYAIAATDGEIGRVKDFYFDDHDWVVRYLVAHTGSWLSGRKVLISPMVIGHPDAWSELLPVSLTRAQVQGSPDIDTEKPVSRQHEISYLSYYGYPYYWGGDAIWGASMYPAALMSGHADFVDGPEESGAKGHASATSAAPRPRDDPHLRSCNAVTGYRIHASDGEIGHVGGFLLDDRTWAIRYLVVKTGNWWLGHEVLVAPQWVEKVDWFNSTVSVTLTKQALRDAPPYNPGEQMDRATEVAIHNHHGRAGYWETEFERQAALTD